MGHLLSKYNKYGELDLIILKHVEKKINQEATSIVKDPETSFRYTIGKSDESKSIYENQFQEMKSKAPFFCCCITTIARSPKHHKNKIKTFDSCIPAIMNSVNNLLLCRSNNMNNCAVINSVVLKHGMADKECMTRMAGLHQCVSYKNVLDKITNLGNDFKEKVSSWSKEISNYEDYRHEAINAITKTENEPIKISKEEVPSKICSLNESFLDKNAKNPTYIEVADTYESEDDIDFESLDCAVDTDSAREESLGLQNLTLHDDIDNDNADDGDRNMLDDEMSFNSKEIYTEPPERPSKFMQCGDNLDKKVKTRHMTKSNQNTDFHLFNAIAVKNRISSPPELDGITPAPLLSKENIDLTKYIPNFEDEQRLKMEFKILVLRDLLKYHESLQWMKQYYPSYITHGYMELTKQKSDITSLGIQHKNENTTEDMIDIMNELHTIVPETKNGFEKVFSIGDLLTVERELNAQEDMRDAKTAAKRLEGLIPALADFHTYGNFLEVIWHTLYDTKSSRDTGTMYQARNFLSARNVTKDPMKDINACEELMFKYSEAMTLTAFQQYQDSTSNKSIFEENADELVNLENIEHILTDLVDQYIYNSSVKEMNETKSSIYVKCSTCQKSYKSRKNLLRHISKIHGIHHEETKNAEAVNDDAVLNYSKNALTLTYLARNFVDARKYGDGERIIRLYKFLMPLFKIDNKSKYAFYSLHLLAQVNTLLPPSLAHELTWNRTVNNTGDIDGNVELDRELEHRNRYAKKELNHFNGKLIPKSIARGKSYDGVRRTVTLFDKAVNIRKPSGNHTSPDWRKDVKELAESYQPLQLFSFFEGRSHQRYPSFPKNVYFWLDRAEFEKWAKENIYEFSKLKVHKFVEE